MQIAARTAAWAKSNAVPYPVVEYIMSDSDGSWFKTGVAPTLNVMAKGKFYIPYINDGTIRGVFGCGWNIGDGINGHFNFAWVRNGQLIQNVGQIYSGTILNKSIQLVQGIYDVAVVMTVSEDRLTGDVVSNVNGVDYHAHYSAQDPTRTIKGNVNPIAILRTREKYSAIGVSGVRVYGYEIETENVKTKGIPIDYNGTGAIWDTATKSVITPEAGSFSLPVS